jgi:hypothetical protein
MPAALVSNMFDRAHLIMPATGTLARKGLLRPIGPRRRRMQDTIFMICMFFGISSTLLIAFTLLLIALKKIRV